MGIRESGINLRARRDVGQLGRDARMYLSRRLNRAWVPPDRVSVNVTLRCNLRCTMCTTCYDSPELSLDEIKGIIDQAASWGVRVFNPLGGEPFIRADFEEIVSHAVSRDFYVTVTTNGTLLDARRAAAVARIPADRFHLNISIDGNEGSHDLVRGRGNWKRAIDGYHAVREADAKAGNARRKILANTILHSRNVDHFHEVLAEQADLGFAGVRILNLFRMDSDVPQESSNLWFRPEQLADLAEMVEDLAVQAEGQGPAGYRIQNSPAELRKIPRYYREDLEPLDAPCWAGWKELYINADGAAIMCDGKLDFLEGRFGNIRENTLQQLWTSPALKARRQVVKQCTTPCVQECYLRPESDSASDLVLEGGRLVGGRLRARVEQMWRTEEHRPGETLRLELTDVCPCGQADCPMPSDRWHKLVANAPVAPTPANWGHLRDRGHVDFGRGFMGAAVVHSVVADLRRTRLRYGTVALNWRGEPLLHPEIDSILEYLLAATEEGVFDRLRIETCGTFLTDGLAELPTRDVRQDWVIDLDRGDGSALDRLVPGPHTRVLSMRGLARAEPCAVGPTVSWDGKVTMDPEDHRLDRVVGSVISGRLSDLVRQAPRQRSPSTGE